MLNTIVLVNINVKTHLHCATAITIDARNEDVLIFVRVRLHWASASTFNLELQIIFGVTYLVYQGSFTRTINVNVLVTTLHWTVPITVTDVEGTFKRSLKKYIRAILLAMSQTLSVNGPKNYSCQCHGDISTELVPDSFTVTVTTVWTIIYSWNFCANFCIWYHKVQPNVSFAKGEPTGVIICILFYCTLL